MASCKPFAFGVAIGSEHFIGRQTEIQRLSAQFRYGINTILMSPRRTGKTSLVKRVANGMQDEEIRIINMDIFACRSEYDFLNAFASAILKQTSSHFEEWKQNAGDFLARLMPKVSFSPEPMSDIALSLGITPKTHTPEEVLNLPEIIAKKKGYRIVVCIDEFQQIGDFPDSLSVQKRMRSVWQHQENVSYCLYGSKKNMMSSLFQQKSKPFYKFGTIMHLEAIPVTEWVPYLCGRFGNEGKMLSPELAEAICNTVELHSSYVQQLAFSTLLRTTGDTVTPETIALAIDDLLDENTSLFIEQTERLTSYQMNFIRAIISGVHKDFGRTAIREGYNLGSASNITRLRTVLLEREIIELREEGLFMADPTMTLWLQRRCLV